MAILSSLVEDSMLVSIDKRGSVGIPKSVRTALDLGPGSNLELQVEDGGAIVLRPVAVFGTVKLSETGLNKLVEARASGTAEMPEWMREAMNHAETDTIEKIPR
jgi:AbrB family looped-hinge helix DNA binding protein